MGAIVLGSAAGGGVHLDRGVPAGEEADRPARIAWRTATWRTGCRWRSDDELGDLARSFNKMTAKVEGVQAEIEEQVRRKTAELEKIHKTLLSSEKMASIGKLAATVAHEINNPLFGILTYAHLVLRGVLKLDIPGRDEMAEQLQTIERESKRCGELVKSLLTFSRQAPSQREPQDLNTVVHRAVATGEAQAGNAEHRAEGEPGGGAAARGMRRQPDPAGDPGADGERGGSDAQGRHAGSDDGIRCDVGEQGVVRVKDSGSGIPQEVLPRIFDPFFTTKEDQNRTGLGLAVAARHCGAACRRDPVRVRAGRGNGVPGGAAGDGGGGGGCRQ